MYLFSQNNMPNFLLMRFYVFNIIYQYGYRQLTIPIQAIIIVSNPYNES